MSHVFLIATVAHTTAPVPAKVTTAPADATAAADVTAASDCCVLWATACWARWAANGGRLLLVKGAGRLNVPGRARTCLVVQCLCES